MCEFNNHFKIEENRDKEELLVLPTKKHVKNVTCFKKIFIGHFLCMLKELSILIKEIT